MEPVLMPDGTWAVFDGHGNQINGEFGTEAEAWDWIKSNPPPETEPEDEDESRGPKSI